MTSVAPNRLASSSRFDWMSITTILDAPAMRAPLTALSPTPPAPKITTVSPVLSFAVFRIEPGTHSETSTISDRATCLHVATGSGRLLLGTQEELRRTSPPALHAKAGDLFLIAPGAHYALINDVRQPLVVARHEIPPEVAFV